jgi:hypothetical protein
VGMVTPTTEKIHAYRKYQGRGSFFERWSTVVTFVVLVACCPISVLDDQITPGHICVHTAVLFLLEALPRNSCNAVVTELFLRDSDGFSASVSELPSNDSWTGRVTFAFRVLYSHQERIVTKVIGTVVTNQSHQRPVVSKDGWPGFDSKMPALRTDCKGCQH